MSPAAQAQTFNVLHNFTGGQDGGHPYAGVTRDAAGNLYGTAKFGGDLTCDAPHGCGTVYQLKHKGSGFVSNPLYSFGVGAGGGLPTAQLSSARTAPSTARHLTGVSMARAWFSS
jgi:uncharacterized repeat protein (TIGR03803 family)